MAVDFEGYGSQLDPTTRIGLFISIWLVIVLLSMITSMAYCCYSIRWQTTLPSRSNSSCSNLYNNVTEVDRNLDTHLDRSTSLIDLLDKLFTIHPYPEPERKKKRRSKRKYETKNGWRRKLKAKRKQWERENQGQHEGQHSNHLLHGNYTNQTGDHKNCLLNTETKQAEKNLPKNQPEENVPNNHSVSNVHKSSSNEALRCPPFLKEENSDCTSKIPPPKPCECHARHIHTSHSSEPYSEQFVLQLPIQAMDNQIDEFCNIMIC